MMLSIFLAKVLGLYLVIASISMLINRKFFKDIIGEFIDNRALLLLSGVSALIFGLLVVVSHNVWQWDWRVLITILGWLGLIQGIVRTVFPNVAISMMKNFSKKEGAYYTCAIVSLLIGLFLCYHGFFGVH